MNFKKFFSNLFGKKLPENNIVLMKAWQEPELPEMPELYALNQSFAEYLRDSEKWSKEP
jgi:hypothetical protein